jgi:hypothetical protein
VRRDTGSDNTDHALFTSAIRIIVPREFPATSGCNWRANVRYARLISSVPAEGATPRTR